MRIYRVLAPQEYECFARDKTLRYTHAWGAPNGMLFPKDAEDCGKFFFFELEDAYLFAKHYENCSINDVILEIELDRETALKYLSVARYYYFDPTNFEARIGMSSEHHIPELYLPNGVIDAKISSGEYRLIYPQKDLKGFAQDFYVAHRNPCLVRLGERLEAFRLARNDSMIYNYQIGGGEEEIDLFTIDPEKLNDKRDFERYVGEKKKLDALFADVLKAYADFAREHEKYMALVPADEPKSTK